MAKITPQQYSQAFLAAAYEEPLKIKEVCHNFLLVLIKNKNLKLLARIVPLVEKSELLKKNVYKVSATSASALSAKAKEEMVRELKKSLAARDIILENKIDKDILGGIILDYNDIRIDASLKKQLALLHKELIK